MITAPYLIQRATINTPLTESSARLSQAVSFDYMGSAEFEFGALPMSFRALQAMKPHWQVRLVPEIKEGESPLRVFSALNDEEFEMYKGYLLKLRNSKNEYVHLKERTEFDLHLKSKYDRANFWWDIQNHVMFSFHKIFMNRLVDHVTASLAYMDTQKEKAK